MKLLRAETHCHNMYSNGHVGEIESPFDSNVTISSQLEKSFLSNLDLLFVTNHNTLDGYEQIIEYKNNHSKDKNSKNNLDNQLRKFNKRIINIESEIEGINSEVNKLELLFINPNKFTDLNKLAEYGEKHKTLKKQSENLELEWEKLSAKVETIWVLQQS